MAWLQKRAKDWFLAQFTHWLTSHQKHCWCVCSFSEWELVREIVKLVVQLVRDQVGGSGVEIKQVTVLATQSLNQQNWLPSCPLTSTCPSIHTQTDRIKARGSWFSFHHVGSRDWTRVVRFGSKCFYPLSHLVGPQHISPVGTPDIQGHSLLPQQAKSL